MPASRAEKFIFVVWNRTTTTTMVKGKAENFSVCLIKPFSFGIHLGSGRCQVKREAAMVDDVIRKSDIQIDSVLLFTPLQVDDGGKKATRWLEHRV